jgi:hypothetical protein
MKSQIKYKMRGKQPALPLPIVNCLLPTDL